MPCLRHNGNAIREEQSPVDPQGGRPQRLYTVNPAIIRGQAWPAGYMPRNEHPVPGQNRQN